MLRALLSLSFWGFRLAYALPITPIISQYCDIFRLWLVFFNGFRVFSDKEKQSLIRKIADTRGILIMTDSDGAGFVIRNFLKGSVDNSKIKNCYIPQIKGKEKRKAKGGKEGLLGVEGVSDEVIINAIRKSGAEIIGEENNIPERKITKADLFVLGLTGTENSEINRKKILKKLGLPSYLSTNDCASSSGSFSKSV